MQLTLWTYEGPPHVGAMRVAAALRDVHYVLHAPQGDTYADLLFTMIERRDRRPPVSYTTFQARDLGGDTAELFKTTTRAAYERFQPAALLVGASCTAELIQDDPGGLAATLGLPIPVIPLELPAYQRKEAWGAAETLYRLVRALAGSPKTCFERKARSAGQRARANILGPMALGFRHRDDLREVRELLDLLGVEVHVVAPLDACAADLARIPEADFNVVLYPELAGSTADWLQRVWQQPRTQQIPIGITGTRAFVEEVARLAGVDPAPVLDRIQWRARWYARSVDSTYLTGKRVFIFGDATHAVAAAEVARHEMGFDVVGLGSYSREQARSVREAAARHGVEPLITDDYLEVEDRITALQPDLVLGTQMERHVAKRLGLPCAVISAPVHVQDFPARHAPQMGIEGANVMFDAWVQPLMMGLEEHLLQMFREDFEFAPGAAPSHLGAHAGGGQPAADERRTAGAPSLPAAASESTASAATGDAIDRAAAEVALMEAAHVRPAITTPARPVESVRAARVDNLPAPATIARPADLQAASMGAARALDTALQAAAATVTRIGPLPTGAPSSRGTTAANDVGWAAEAERELQKIPFFVRGKARRNTERYARERGLALITLETLYDAKAHFSA